MYIYTLKPTYKLKEILLDIIRLIFKRFDSIYVKNFINIISLKIKRSIKISKTTSKKIVSILIVIPIIIIILALLISADVQFKNLFNFIYKPLNNINLWDIGMRIFLIIIKFIFTGAFINYLLYKYEKEEYPENKTIKIEQFTIKLLLISLNAIYIIFDIIQIKSLFLHHIGNGIVYSEYARTGFFQLMFVSIINICILLLSKKSKETKLTKNLSLLMVLLTFIIICSSFYRMYMYDTAYGYTILRLLVYITLITETILLIPTIIYIYNSKIKILKYYIIIITIIYSIINIYSIDKIIAKNNINRYERTKKIDIEYLIELSYDDVEELYNFYNKVQDKKIKTEIKDSICYKYVNNQYNMLNNEIYRKDKNIFEYNYNRDKAYKVIKRFNCTNK